jgi:hypothetical protein
MKINKTEFDLLEEIFLIPFFLIIFITSTFAYSISTGNQADDSNRNAAHGQIEKLTCKDEGLFGKKIYLTGYAANPNTTDKIRLRFLLDGQLINNYYLSPPVVFAEKDLGFYEKSGKLSMQIYDKNSNSFLTLDESNLACNEDANPIFDENYSYIKLDKNQIKPDGVDYAIMEIGLFDQFRNPMIGQNITAYLTDYYADGTTNSKTYNNLITGHNAIARIKVVYDTTDQPVDKVEIGYSVDGVMAKNFATLYYSTAAMTVRGGLYAAQCDQEMIVSLHGWAENNDLSPVKIKFFLGDEENHRRSTIGQTFTDTNQNNSNHFALDFSKKLLDNNNLYVFAEDTNGELMPIGYLDSNCEIK